MTETLEMKINKNTEIVFDFYVDKILPLIKIKNKNVILIGLGNTKFIKQIKSVAKNVCIIDHCLPFERDYKLIDENQLEIDIKKYLEKNNMPKFDIAIMNPPYDGNLHLKILEKVIPLSTKLIHISPVRWLQDPLANQKKSSDYKRFEDSISKKIENLDIYSAKEMQNVFAGTVMNIDLAIYTIGKGGYDYTKVSYNSILEKVFTHQKKLCNIESNKKLGWRVRMPTILGGKSGGSGNRKIGLSGFGKLLYFYNGEKDGKPWYDWYVKNQYSKTTPEITSSILFNSEAECKNFIDSLQNTKFGKYVTHKLITDVNVSNKIVLWMGDYSKPWDDKRFCEYFGITGYISDTEAEPNSEWEIILNTMKEYV